MIQENYAMDAVQRDLNVLLTQDQIDNGGLYHLHDARSERAKRGDDALETQLAKIEKQSNFHHPQKSDYHARDDDARCRDAVSRRRARRDR